MPSRPFTIAEARAGGLTPDVLRGPRFVRMHRGVYRAADLPATPEVRVAAARLALPPDAVLSHTTALWWLGVTLKEPRELHFSTNTTSQTFLDNVCLHRRGRLLDPVEVRGVPTVRAERALVDCGVLLGHVDLVRAGDWLTRLCLTDPDRIWMFARDQHLHGVQRVRRVSSLIRSGVESVKETDVRLMLRFARLPEPAVNLNLLDTDGNFLARGDLPYPEFMVLVEYDGWQHERNAQQRQKDHLRRERLEAAGWRLIVITVEDLADPQQIVKRVHGSLVERGYTGPDPVFSAMWCRWFVRNPGSRKP